MAQIERPNFCELAEYRRVFDKRLKDGSLDEAAILTLYLRLEEMQKGIKSPVQFEVKGRSAAGLAVDIYLLDEDLRVKPNELRSGIMFDGVWNAQNKRGGFCWTNERGRQIPAYDGVFAEYDDGLDMRLFEEALAGAGASTVGLDLGTQRLK